MSLAIRVPIVFVACGLISPRLAAAEESPGRFELTPYAAFRFGGEFDERDGPRDFALDDHAARGLIFTFRADKDGEWEALYAHQTTKLEAGAEFDGAPPLELDVDYLQFGGAYRFDGTAIRPFVAATVGAAHFSPRLGFDAETRLSGSLGGGVHLRADSGQRARTSGGGFSRRTGDGSGTSTGPPGGDSAGGSGSSGGAIGDGVSGGGRHSARAFSSVSRTIAEQLSRSGGGRGIGISRASRARD
jgi:hypothetical protein